MFKTDEPIMPLPVLLTTQEVVSKMADPAVVLLNVLSEQDFEKFHIKGSENLTLGVNIRNFGIQARRKYPVKTQFITYGLDKESSLGLNAARVLVGSGFKADHYRGGILEWVTAALPMEGTVKNVSVVLGPPLEAK